MKLGYLSLRPEPPAPPPPMRPWVPLAGALLCLEDGCEAVYPFDGLPCPACGSREAMPLQRVTDRTTTEVPVAS